MLRCDLFRYFIQFRKRKIKVIRNNIMNEIQEYEFENRQKSAEHGGSLLFLF